MRHILMQDETSRASLNQNCLKPSCSLQQLCRQLHYLSYCYLSEHTLKLCSITRGFVDRKRLRSCCKTYNLGDFERETWPAQLAQCFSVSRHRDVDMKELEVWILYMINYYWGEAVCKVVLHIKMLNFSSVKAAPLRS